MNKIIIGIVVLVICNACVMTQTVVKPPSNVNVPKNALFISQSGTESNMMQTLIDMDNNEMVVLTYNLSNLINVARTGIFLNPGDYKNRKLKGSDAPFKKEEKDPKLLNQEEK